MVRQYSAKGYLEQSALELLSKREIGHVTVKDICQTCGFSTRTFYKYYRDKYEIINTCFNAELEKFYELPHEQISIYPFLQYTTQIVHDHIDFHKNVFRYTGQNNNRLYLVIPLSSHYLRIISEYRHGEITRDIKDAVTFYIQGQLSFVEEALIRTTIPAEDDTVEFFKNAAPAKLLLFLKCSFYTL